MRALIVSVALTATTICPELAVAQVVTVASEGAHAAIARAVALLPRRPARIVVLDRNSAMARRPTLSKGVEAFVPTGDTTIYLIEEGDCLQHAVSQGAIFDYALALTIWHEMAHVEGADEREAQRREEALWQVFIVEGRVDRDRGMKYLALLRRRH